MPIDAGRIMVNRTEYKCDAMITSKFLKRIYFEAVFRWPMAVKQSSNQSAAEQAHVNSGNISEAAAKSWTTWEMSTSFAKPNVEYIEKGDDSEFAAAFARIETHYFVNLGWLPTPNHILENIDKIRHIPTFFTHGRYDVVCPFKSAFDLSQAFPEAEFVVCGQSGHSAGEAEHTSELVMACDRFAGKA